MNHATINADYIADCESIRAEIEAKASTMTLKEVTAELLRLPASPESDADVICRAALTQRRIDLEEIDRRQRAERAAVQDNGAPLIEVTIPKALGATAIEADGKFYYPEPREDGRYIVRMPWSRFYQLAMSPHNVSSSSGVAVNGAVWLEENPNLQARLPRNPPPPMAEGPR